MRNDGKVICILTVSLYIINLCSGIKTYVHETPNHKQRSRLAYRREQVVKHYWKKGPPAVAVVAESPEKEGASTLAFV